MSVPVAIAVLLMLLARTLLVILLVLVTRDTVEKGSHVWVSVCFMSKEECV